MPEAVPCVNRTLGLNHSTMPWISLIGSDCLSRQRAARSLVNSGASSVIWKSYPLANRKSFVVRRAVRLFPSAKGWKLMYP